MAHALFLTCAGALFMFCGSSGRYFEKLKNSVFITAYTECRSEADLAAVKNRIAAISGVKHIVILTENEVFAALEGALAKKDILLSIKDIEIPSILKIYPGTLNYERFGKIAEQINALAEIKSSDTGGNAVKKLFVFASDFKKAVRFITALLILSALASAAAAFVSMKYLSEKFQFLAERNVPRRDIVFKYAAEITLIPLSSLIISILILLAFYQTTGGNTMVFFTYPRTLLLLLLASLPSAVRLIKSV